MKISWKLKVGYFGEGTWELSEKMFNQVHINDTTEKYYKTNGICYWHQPLKKFHKRLFA